MTKVDGSVVKVQSYLSIRAGRIILINLLMMRVTRWMNIYNMILVEVIVDIEIDRRWILHVIRDTKKKNKE